MEEDFLEDAFRVEEVPPEVEEVLEASNRISIIEKIFL